ncbi:hypothetical protein BDM02DRAFT_2472123 [Thelephora ganbajun]|uniref:Uncharacterized protein n=1 Tax=Thelephora ganbajun TaxID=370292 RepID=A0ACB6ZEU5_THEGA|nr:hypothetical protein BDM02DRAFT_2472123 [Thelephora ganbajun]
MMRTKKTLGRVNRHRPVITSCPVYRLRPNQGHRGIHHRPIQRPHVVWPFYPMTIGRRPRVHKATTPPDIPLRDPRPPPSSQIMPSATPALPETVSWQTLSTLDWKSDDFTHSAKLLLSDQRHRKSEVSRFTEEEALKFVELIESTILQHVNIPGDLKNTAFDVLRRLCGTFGILPKSFLIDEDFKTQAEIPFATRENTDLWKREWNGGKVAVKALRFAPDDDWSRTVKVTISLVDQFSEIPGELTITYHLQRFCKEVPVWKRLNHPNILPFYGVSMDKNQFCTVFPWMKNGNVLTYTRKNPEANRLKLLVDVTSGLKYLHRVNLVHGTIRGVCLAATAVIVTSC